MGKGAWLQRGACRRLELGRDAGASSEQWLVGSARRRPAELLASGSAATPGSPAVIGLQPPTRRVLLFECVARPP